MCVYLIKAVKQDQVDVVLIKAEKQDQDWVSDKFVCNSVLLWSVILSVALATFLTKRGSNTCGAPGQQIICYVLKQILKIL